MKKLKKIFQTKLFYFILGIFVCGTVSVWAQTYFPSNDVTYDNKTSGLESTNVQGAIDELYSACFPSFTIGGKPVTIVTSGDGLYADEYEEGKYTYKGANPNNYVTFNDEKAGWRIISIDSNGIIKIIKNKSIDSSNWGSNGTKEWTNASLNTYLNNTYYNSLTSTAKTQIVSLDFSVGKIPRANNNLINQINLENNTKWNGKIALATVSEYLRANSNKSVCETLTLSNNNSICKNTNWMFNYKGWTLTTTSENYYYTFSLGSTGIIDASNDYLYAQEIYPTLHLSSNIKITSGDGSQSNPYTIE